MNGIGVKAAALLVGLPLFLLSCEKDLGERGAGKKVTINFTVGNEGYGADQQILKGSGVKEAKPETVYIPLDNNYFIAATLTPEPEEEVRATEAFALNQKIRFVAYNGAMEEGSAIYTWDGSEFVADDEQLKVEPDNGVTYHFVAYSFFGDQMAEPDDEDVEADIEPVQDLVWGEKDQEIHNNVAGRTVQIVMKHKFSRVRVRVDASSFVDADGVELAEITDIDDVVIEGGKKMNLTVKTGVVAASGSDITGEMDAWTAPKPSTRLSGYKLFCPALTAVTVGSLDIEIDGTALATLTNKSATFALTLGENRSYTVLVDVRELRSAYSNIYWDDVNKRMRFEKTKGTAVTENSNQYQGVFFKWGSLVGISPVGGETQGDVSNVIVYLPTSGGNWNATTSTVGAQGGWNSIPFTDTSDLDYGNWLYEHPAFNNKKGDVCNYIDNDWRMQSENEPSSSYSPWISGTLSNANAAGTGIVTKGRIRETLFFPASGYRAETGISTSDFGIYWLGSCRNAFYTYGFVKGFDATVGIMSPSYRNAKEGASIRCIKKLPGE
jgi:hypothetical protein